MKNLFPEIPDALKNSMKIVEDCNIEFSFDEFHLPDFKVPPGYDIVSFLRHLCMEGLKVRYPDSWQELMARMDYELKVIHYKGYDAYFVIIWNFINYARKNGIPIRLERRSAVGSLVSYVLGITDLDPIQYDLIFERFLNPERKSLPDIDINFCYNRRQEVINYAKDLYGQYHVAQIIRFGRMKARAIIRDVGRVFELSLPFINKIVKLIPSEAKNIKEALEIESELKTSTEKICVERFLDTAQELEGLARHPGIHPAAVVISRYPIEQSIPLHTIDVTDISTQYEVKSLEKIGFLKIGFYQ